MTELPLWIQIPVAILLVAGGLFTLIGAIGMLRFDDFFQRLHAPTKATTLGVGGVVVASMVVHLALGEPALREILISMFLFVTAPVSANLMAKAALHLRIRANPDPPEELPHD